MQLNRFAGASLLVALLTLPAAGQSLSPMHKTGVTPTDVKGFRLRIGNPYSKPMTFVIEPMDTQFINHAEQAEVTPAEAKIPPGGTRSVVVQFRIPPDAKERSVSVCVYPKEIEGSVIPRVCGTYTGQLLPKRRG